MPGDSPHWTTVGRGPLTDIVDACPRRALVFYGPVANYLAGSISATLGYRYVVSASHKELLCYCLPAVMREMRRQSSKEPFESGRFRTLTPR